MEIMCDICQRTFEADFDSEGWLSVICEQCEEAIDAEEAYRDDY